jgi:hypothetical protein
MTVELYPTQDVTADEIPTGDLTITLPTRLTEDYWGQAIPQDVYVGVTEDEYADDVHELELDFDTTDGGELKLNTVGIQSEPLEGGQKQNVGTGSEESGNDDFSGLTAEVTKEGSDTGPNKEWSIRFTYDGPEDIDITAEPNNPGSGMSSPQPASGTINQGSSPVTLNFDSGSNNDIYPITVTGESGSKRCSTTLSQGDGPKDICG